MSGAPTAEFPVATRQTMNGLRVTDVGSSWPARRARHRDRRREPAAADAEQRALDRAHRDDELGVTPQISGDSVLTLSLTPIVRSPAVVESDMLARVADGETLVVSGFTRDREIKEKKAVGINGGWFGRGTVVTHRRVEMVILLTARIVAGVAGQ
jgi:hypothetical protein